MSSVDENPYGRLLALRDRLREEEPEPRFSHGCFTPFAASGKTLLGVGWDPLEILEAGRINWFRLSFPLVLIGAEKLGWEKWISVLNEYQREGTQEAARQYRKELGLEGNDIPSACVVSCAGTTGVGFDWHHLLELTDDYWKEAGDGCPVIESIREMGMGDSQMLEDLSLWCDCYDNFEVHVTNPDIWFTHTHCQGRGDRYCRSRIDYRYDVKGNSYFEKLKYMRDTKRAEEPEIEHEMRSAFGVPRIAENISAEEALKLGNDIQRRIGVATILIGADIVGWEDWINSIVKRIVPRWREYARKKAVNWGVTGNTAVDAAALMNMQMLGMGFDDHQLVRFTNDKVEGVARTCPIIESAKELCMEDKLENISLYCDALHGGAVKAANRNLNCTFTHCLGNGDTLCRWIIQ